MAINRLILAIFVFCLVGLIGCQKEVDVSKKQEDEKGQTVELPVTSPVVDSINEQLIEPVTITVIHPHTFEVIAVISPEQLGFHDDPVQYIETLEQYAKQLARGTETESGFDQSMVLDRIGDDGQVMKGSPKVILKESELVDKILAASEKGGRVYLPIYVSESNYYESDLLHLNETVVATYTTYFNAAEEGRSKNIELSANALDQIIVGVGDIFSFNTMVGERTVEKGYQPAPEIINKKRVMGIGGGICQTSSTLFNAVDLLKVDMKERHHHSISIGYVPEGRDATVAYGVLDFKFQNTTDVPFIIRTKYVPGAITVEIRTATRYASTLTSGSG